MKNKVMTIKDKCDIQIQQTKISCEEIIRTKFQKRKLQLNKVCQKKDFHFMLNSFLRGDVFEEDILDEFWEHHFRETALVSDVIKAYNNSIMYVLQKIIENNLKIYELGKQREKHKQQHNFTALNTLLLQLDHLNIDINQYTNDLFELCKPFDIDLTPIIAKFKPYKNKVNQDEPFVNQKDIMNDVFVMLDEKVPEIVPEVPVVIEDDIKNEEKYYRFVVYLSILVFIGDCSTSLSKLNFVDLIGSLLLLLNSLFQNYIVIENPFEEKLNYLAINYIQNRVTVQEIYPSSFNVKAITSRTVFSEHHFERYVYSSMCLIGVMVIFDIFWLLLFRNDFYYKQGHDNKLILSTAMWKYNHYVVYTSIVMLIVKVLMFLLLTRVVEVQFSKFVSRFNFIMNFVRFTNLTFLAQLIKNP